MESLDHMSDHELTNYLKKHANDSSLSTFIEQNNSRVIPLIEKYVVNGDQYLNQMNAFLFTSVGSMPVLVPLLGFFYGILTSFVIGCYAGKKAYDHTMRTIESFKQYL